MFFQACGYEFLDVKRDANQVVPATIKDYASILNRDIMSYTSSDLQFLGSDEYFVNSTAELIAESRYTPFHRYAYTWADRVYNDSEKDIRDWHQAYERIMCANLALDVEKIEPANEELEEWKRVRIAARFHRAWNFYHLAQSFCEVFDHKTASNKLGLPLRLDYDVTVSYGRSSLQSVYDLILKDLLDAELISQKIQSDIHVPDILAVRALLARVYLQMGRYAEALDYSNLVLQSKNELVDYNKLSGAITSIYSSLFEPYGHNNPSIIYYSSRGVGGIMGPRSINMDTLLYKEFAEDDLRKKVYYFIRPNGTRVFVGSYCGMGALEYFTGLTVEEVLLIRAECYARLERPQDAIRDLNRLEEHRYVGHQSKMPDNQDEALLMVLAERHKELYMRGRRWEDVRRLNREGQYMISFGRLLEGNNYLLGVKSNKWIWPIPENEIVINGLKQNDR